ncbi:hypothetical protein ZWY2020_053120 [Hordeum vulgare]|nr:hypothetical protein ZWY2020_053120 [Hordeum vulgare]
MESSENLPKMEPVEVSEDPCFALVRKINSATRQDHCVKANATKEEKLKKLLAISGPTGGDGCEDRGGWRGRGRCRKMSGRIAQTTSLPESYKPPY